MTSLATSFTYKNFFILYPVGTIASYLGISDPDGWVICDGVQRNGGNGRYSELKNILNTAMNTTVNTSDSITPPDLRQRFLYGRSQTNSTSNQGGSSTVTLALNQMPKHKHTITINDPGHNHTWNYGLEGDDDGRGGSYNEFTTIAGSNTNSIASATTNITASMDEVGGTTPVDILPPYYTINYIIKY